MTTLTARGLSLILFAILVFTHAQTTNIVEGNWIENNPGNPCCPALAIGPDDIPIIVAARPIDVDGPNVFSTYYWYKLQFLNNTIVQNEWTAVSFPINLNPFENISDVTLSSISTEQENIASFISWVETKSRYEETSIVVGNMDEYKNDDLLSSHIFQIDPSKYTFSSSSTLDKQGNPVIAWSEGHTDRVVYEDYINRVTFVDTTAYTDTMTYVRQWSGQNWQDLGTSIEGFNPSIALNNQDVLYMTYFKSTDLENQLEVVTVYWDGETWQQIGEAFQIEKAAKNLQYFGGVISRSSLTIQPSLILDDNGMPVISWISNDFASGLPKLFIKRWNGRNWQSVGEDSAITIGNFPKDFAIAYRASKLVLAVSETSVPLSTRSAPIDLYVREWDGKTWELLGDSKIQNAVPVCPVLALDSEGTPYIAWNQPLVNRTIVGSQVMLRYFVKK